MIVETADGRFGKVLLGTDQKDGDIIAGGGGDKDTWYPLKYVAEDLEDTVGSSNYTIVRVYAMESNMYGASIKTKGEIVWESTRIVIKLTDTHDAEVSKDGTIIKVGCQDIKVSTVKELIKRIEEKH